MPIIEILTFVCISHIFILIILFFIKTKKINYYILMGIGISSFLFLPLTLKYNFPKIISFFLLIWIIMIPFFFWLISLDLSQKNFKPSKKHWLILGLKILISIFSLRNEKSFFFLTSMSEFKNEFFQAFPPAIFSIILILLSLYNFYTNIQHDLVESKKKIRLEILILSGLGFLIILILRIVLHSKKLEEYFFLTTHFIILISVYTISVTVLNLKEFIFGDILIKEKSVIEIDQELLSKLNRTFQEEKYFCEEGLTIRKLSQYMNVPEHHLRRLINEGMGFKNFNDFLNRYRIQEACEILLKKKKQEMPIIRIAMDLGYKSLASFNKAFKEINGMTPSEFRQQEKKADGF